MDESAELLTCAHVCFEGDEVGTVHLTHSYAVNVVRILVAKFLCVSCFIGDKTHPYAFIKHYITG